LSNISHCSAASIDPDSAESAKLAGYPIFDWLRFILASVVALGHASLITHSEITGNLAVQVFFSLSGWLIGGILLNSRFEQLPRFFFNRATRIWLPYFFAVGALYALSAVREPLTARWIEFLYYDVTFTHNWFTLRPDAALALSEMPLKGTGNGFWGISVEEQFYLIAPLIIVAVKFGRSPILWVLISAILWFFQLTDFASISLGVLAAATQRLHGNLHLRRWFIVVLTGISLMSLLALINVSYALGAPFFAISIVLLRPAGIP
jgi:peptidoglycan/LPS O-acetylase OafA/YrhL